MLQFNPCRMRFAGSPPPTDRKTEPTQATVAAPRPVYAKPMAWSDSKDDFQPSQPTTKPTKQKHADEDNLQTLLAKALERMNLYAKPPMPSIPENQPIGEVSETKDAAEPMDVEKDWQKLGASINRPKAPLPLVQRTLSQRVRNRMQPYGESPKKKAKNTEQLTDKASPEPLTQEGQRSASPFAGINWPVFLQRP